MSRQHFIKTIRDDKGQLIYFNFGLDVDNKYVNTCIGLSDKEYICITCYQPEEVEDYRETVQEYLKDSKARISAII